MATLHITDAQGVTIEAQRDAAGYVVIHHPEGWTAGLTQAHLDYLVDNEGWSFEIS